MKTVKFNFAIMALVMGMALTFVTSAFKAASVEALDTSWFEYNGFGEINDPSSYEKMAGTPTCDASQVLDRKSVV